MLHWKMSSLIVEEVKKHRLESKLIAMEVERLQKEETFTHPFSRSGVLTTMPMSMEFTSAKLSHLSYCRLQNKCKTKHFDKLF